MTQTPTISDRLASIQVAFDQALNGISHLIPLGTSIALTDAISALENLRKEIEGANDEPTN